MSAAVLSSSLPVGKPKMENDRKRAADLDDASGPPLKRQITMANGASNASGEAADAPKFGSINSSWQVDLDVCIESGAEV